MTISLEDYANKYRTIRMERRNVILQMTLHSDGGPLRWGFLPHGELPDAFYDVGADRENRVLIITAPAPSSPGRGRTTGRSAGSGATASSVARLARRPTDETGAAATE